eukprot:766306-Prorocentrum_minimum.AAC.2
MSQRESSSKLEIGEGGVGSFDDTDTRLSLGVAAPCDVSGSDDAGGSCPGFTETEHGNLAEVATTRSTVVADLFEKTNLSTSVGTRVIVSSGVESTAYRSKRRRVLGGSQFGHDECVRQTFAHMHRGFMLRRVGRKTYPVKIMSRKGRKCHRYDRVR